MPTKTAVIASISLLLAIVIIGVIIVATMSGPRIDERAAKLGNGMGTLCAIGWAVIWGWWALSRRANKKPPARRKRRKEQD